MHVLEDGDKNTKIAWMHTRESGITWFLSYSLKPQCRCISTEYESSYKLLFFR